MKLKQFTIESGGKTTPAAPIVIDFSKSNMVGLLADQEGGKTIAETIFLLTTGNLGGEKLIADLKNRETGLLKSNLSFVGNDKADYEIQNTNGRLTVKREGDKMLGGAQELLKKMLGQVGTSPMGIKNADIDDIVKWLAGYSTRGVEEFKAEIKKLKDAIKKAKEARADANKSAKGAREFLVGEGYVDASGELIEKVWTKSEKDFSKEPDIKELSKKLKAAGDKSDKYLENKTKVDGQRSRKIEIEKQIADLQVQLQQTSENIRIGEEWITKNENAQKEYDAVKKEYDGAAQSVVDYNKWQQIKQKKQEWDDFSDVAIKADGKEKELLAKVQELQWEVIPDVKGVELVLDDEYEDGELVRKAGFYYKKMNSRQLSASEWFGVVVQILKKNKIQILVVDDISQFGSKFMETLETLAKSGCFILYSEMKRGQEILEIEYR